LARSELFLQAPRRGNSLQICSSCFWLTVFPVFALYLHCCPVCVLLLYQTEHDVCGCVGVPNISCLLDFPIYFSLPEAQYHPAVPHATRCGVLLPKSATDSSLGSIRSHIRFCPGRVHLQAPQLLTLQSSLVTLCTTYCNNEKICVFFTAQRA
jgi:hypothetical protein